METFFVLLAFCSPHKGQWRGALMFSLICAWTDSWANNGDPVDLRRLRVHYDVIVMNCYGASYTGNTLSFVLGKMFKYVIYCPQWGGGGGGGGIVCILVLSHLLCLSYWNHSQFYYIPSSCFLRYLLIYFIFIREIIALSARYSHN